MKGFALSLVAISMLAAPAMAQTTAPTTSTPTATTTKDTYVTATQADMLASNLIGLNIKNSKNETIGEIKDVLLSAGNAAGYIVSVGGFLGIGEHYVAVTPASVKISYSENDKKWSATMEATKESLKAAPQFKYEGRWAK